jgi:chitinase
MKKETKKFVLLLMLLSVVIYKKESLAAIKHKEKVVVAYVTSWTSVLPDPTCITHINYAFGHVNNTFDGVRIDNEERLKTIVALKKQHPKLKVMLSIGGWGSGRFSEMAAEEVNRKKFAKDCLRVVNLFGLDGIDIDWEYPTSSAGNISSSPEDTGNFTLLMQDIRKAIGRKKLLTLATVASGKYIAFSDINPVVDFVNIMTYDSGNPPFHHASLFRSPMSGGTTCEEAVIAHVAAGMPIEKLVLGIPFYGRGNKKEINGFVDYKNLITLSDYEEKWDEVAKAPYLVNAEGEFVCTYETPASILLKCQFLKEKGMLGAMYWEYAGDTEDGVLRQAVFQGVTQ